MDTINKVSDYVPKKVKKIAGRRTGFRKPIKLLDILAVLPNDEQILITIQKDTDLFENIYNGLIEDITNEVFDKIISATVIFMEDEKFKNRKVKRIYVRPFYEVKDQIRNTFDSLNYERSTQIEYVKQSADKKREVFSSDAISAICHCDIMEFDKTKGEPICPYYSKNCGIVISEGNCEWI